MSGERYQVINESATSHCCFSHSVVDTTQRKEPMGAVGVMCECFDQADAELICRALNLLHQEENW